MHRNRLALILTTLLMCATLSPAQAQAPTAVSFAKPKGSVSLKAKVFATGNITGGTRPVLLQFKTRTGWRELASGTSTDEGAFKIRIPTTWAGTHTMRLSAPATTSDDAANSRTRTMTVRLGYDPVGSRSAYRLTDATNKPHWDACKPIKYYLNPSHAPGNARKLIRQALQRVRVVTGFRFKYSGHTRKVPHSGANQFPTSGLAFAYTTPRKVPGLAGGTAGLGGAEYQVTSEPNSAQILRGGVSIDRLQREPVRGFGPGQSEGALLMHEIGHTLGLFHSSARNQLMYPALLNSTRARYGAGDLKGLSVVGAKAGCF